MLDKFKTIFTIVVCIILISYSYYRYNPISIEIDNTEFYLLDEVSENSYLQRYSENTGKTDLVGISNIILNMLDDGYKIQNYKNTGDYIDIILQNNDEVHRLYFNKEYELTVISSPYNKSIVPYTYINEREGK